MSGVVSRIAALIPLTVLAACAATRDDLEVARESLGQGDLLTTIVHLDRVPPTHAEYLEARSLARAVERRMRTGQRLFTRGLALRAEWRDEEAIESFELARQVWPYIAGVDRMIEATRQRMLALTPATDPDPERLPDTAIATTAPIVEPDVLDAEQPFGPMPAERIQVPVVEAEQPAGPVAVEPATPAPAPGSETEPAAPVQPDVGAPTAAGIGRDRLLQIRLDRASASLARGELDEALDALEAMRVEFPDAPVVQELLGRVLHQRALLLYGQGQLQAALDAWARILEIDPEHAQAREFHRAAETELRSLRAAPAR